MVIENGAVQVFIVKPQTIPIPIRLVRVILPCSSRYLNDSLRSWAVSTWSATYSGYTEGVIGNISFRFNVRYYGLIQEHPVFIIPVHTVMQRSGWVHIFQLNKEFDQGFQFIAEGNLVGCFQADFFQPVTVEYLKIIELLFIHPADFY